MARDGIGKVFVEPALDYLRARGVTIQLRAWPARRLSLPRDG